MNIYLISPLTRASRSCLNIHCVEGHEREARTRGTGASRMRSLILPEEQRLAKKAIEHINNFQEEQAAFANFVKMGFETLIQDVQQYLVKVGRFDLEILTQEGFEALQECIYYMISELLNDVYEVVETDLNNKK